MRVSPVAAGSVAAHGSSLKNCSWRRPQAPCGTSKVPGAKHVTSFGSRAYVGEAAWPRPNGWAWRCASCCRAVHPQPIRLDDRRPAVSRAVGTERLPAVGVALEHRHEAVVGQRKAVSYQEEATIRVELVSTNTGRVRPSVSVRVSSRYCPPTSVQAMKSSPLLWM